MSCMTCGLNKRIQMNKTISEIINELNQENGSNYKMEVLKKHKDNKLLQKVLKMTYDKVTYTYGITMKNIKYTPESMRDINVNLEDALDVLEQFFVTREWTGNKAIQALTNLLSKLSKDDAEVLEKVINRDLRINMGRSNINKVFKNLIVKPPYMRCGIYSDKTAKKIDFSNGAYIQLKCDGMFQAVTVENGNVTFTARSGEERKLPHLEQYFKTLNDGVYIGELLVHGINNRAISNGIINSDDEEAKKGVYIQLWDYITLEEYSRPKDKKGKTFYEDRFAQLLTNIKEVPDTFINIVPTTEVFNVTDALQKVQEWMSQELEGGILKDKKNIFIDHTSPTQLKLKLELDADVRVTGFIEGKKGTKREQTFGAMMFETDDGLIKGSCSGFSDKELEDFNSRRDELIGKVITVQFNDTTKGRDNEYYALSHPRFIEIRNDKNETDTLQRVQEMKSMVLGLVD